MAVGKGIASPRDGQLVSRRSPARNMGLGGGSTKKVAIKGSVSSGNTGPTADSSTVGTYYSSESEKGSYLRDAARSQRRVTLSESTIETYYSSESEEGSSLYNVAHSQKRVTLSESTVSSYCSSEGEEGSYLYNVAHPPARATLDSADSSESEEGPYLPNVAHSPRRTTPPDSAYSSESDEGPYLYDGVRIAKHSTLSDTKNPLTCASTAGAYYSSESEEEPYPNERAHSKRRVALLDTRVSLPYAPVTATNHSTSQREVSQYLKEVARSPMPVTMSDARIALSYIQGKMGQMMQRGKASGNGETVQTLERSSNGTVQPASKVSRRDSQGKVISSKNHTSSSKTYSRFGRTDKNVIHGEVEVAEQDDDHSFNNYFVERPASISNIKDTLAKKANPTGSKDNSCHHALRAGSNNAPRARPSRAAYPPLPPTKPPPLQLHTSASRKHTGVSRRSRFHQSNDKDDDVSHATHVDVSGRALVMLDLDKSADDCCDLLNGAPPLPPAKPPLLQLDISASGQHTRGSQRSRFHQSNYKDNDVSFAMHAGVSNSALVVLDLDQSADDCSDLFNDVA